MAAQDDDLLGAEASRGDHATQAHDAVTDKSPLSFQGWLRRRWPHDGPFPSRLKG
jgi:hypothetical protein